MKKFGYLALFIVVLLQGSSCGSDETVTDHDIPDSAVTNVITEEPSSEMQETVLEGNSADLTEDTDVASVQDCLDIDEVVLTESPVVLDDLSYIFPMGLMTNAHVTPVDHQYYYWKETDVPVERYPVYSPADGYVTEISTVGVDYRVIINHSCEVYSIYIHLERLAGALAGYEGKIDWGKSVRPYIFVKAGELISYDGGTNGFDFSLHDERIILPGFINPESYTAEPWKIHTVDPYDYFTEPVRSLLLEKNLRQVEPYGGKIDYDIPGRLSGNWFVENTDGYAGSVDDNGPVEPNQQIGYWNTHLAIAPDPIDPSITKISSGWFDSGCIVGAVQPPHIDPADITSETGTVKWELSVWYYAHAETGESWNYNYEENTPTDLRIEFGSEIYGTALFRLLDDDHLKVEMFPDKTADEISGFTDGAVIYTR